MKKQSILVAVMGLSLAGCGVIGAKGNDTGGIIPWTPESEANAKAIAQDQCGQFKKYAVITSVHRTPGDYIAYVCQWDPPRGRRWR